MSVGFVRVGKCIKIRFFFFKVSELPMKLKNLKYRLQKT